MDDFFELREAAAILGVSYESLRMKAKRKRFETIRIDKPGGNYVLAITKSILQQLSSKKPEKNNYNDLHDAWMQAQNTGLIDGKIYSKKTIETNINALKRFWRHSGLAPDIRQFTAMNVIKGLSKYPFNEKEHRCSHTAKKTSKNAIINFLKFLKLQELATDKQIEAVSAVKIKRAFPPRKTKLSTEGVDKLFESLALVSTVGSYSYWLNHTMLMLLLHTGLRRSEMLALKIDDINLPEGYLTVQCGKGKKKRNVGLSGAICRVLEHWMGIRVKGDYLLSLTDGRGMTEASFLARFKTAKKKSGLDITPHGLRRTFATRSSQAGIPLELVSKTLGHTDLKTTQGYLMSTEQDAVNAFRRLDNPEMESPVASEGKTVGNCLKKRSKLDLARELGLL